MDTQNRGLKTVENAKAPETKESWGRWKERGGKILLAATIAATVGSMAYAIYIGNKLNPANCAQTTQEMRALAEKSDSLSQSFGGALERVRQGHPSDANAAEDLLRIISERQYVDTELSNKITVWRTQCAGQEKPTQ